tara:strand:- start:198 stop:593 length:396 start_codon:yes stop_codon:yes gene_type:complete
VEVALEDHYVLVLFLLIMVWMEILQVFQQSHQQVVEADEEDPVIPNVVQQEVLVVEHQEEILVVKPVEQETHLPLVRLKDFQEVLPGLTQLHLHTILTVPVVEEQLVLVPILNLAQEQAVPEQQQKLRQVL